MPHIKDSVRRPLHVGDKLIVTNGEPAVYTLLDVQPCVDPRAPKDAVLVTFQSTLRLMLRDGQVMPGFMRVMSVAEQGIGEGSDANPNEGQPEKATNRLIS